MSTGNWLDDVAKTLARGRSRRDVLKAISAALVGGLVAGAGATRVRAQGDRSACAEFCRGLGRTGRELGECIADCERSGGVVSCGPTVCAPGEVCCNESCGICTPPGGFCIQIVCEPPTP